MRPCARCNVQPLNCQWVSVSHYIPHNFQRVNWAARAPEAGRTTASCTAWAAMLPQRSQHQSRPYDTTTYCLAAHVCTMHGTAHSSACMQHRSSPRFSTCRSNAPPAKGALRRAFDSWPPRWRARGWSCCVPQCCWWLLVRQHSLSLMWLSSRSTLRWAADCFPVSLPSMHKWSITLYSLSPSWHTAQAQRLLAASQSWRHHQSTLCGACADKADNKAAAIVIMPACAYWCLINCLFGN